MVNCQQDYASATCHQASTARSGTRWSLYKRGLEYQKKFLHIWSACLVGCLWREICMGQLGDCIWCWKLRVLRMQTWCVSLSRWRVWSLAIFHMKGNLKMLNHSRPNRFSTFHNLFLRIISLKWLYKRAISLCGESCNGNRVTRFQVTKSRPAIIYKWEADSLSRNLNS